MPTRSPQVKRFESPKEKKERHALECAKAKAWSVERKKRIAIASAATTKISKEKKKKKQDCTGISESSYSTGSSIEPEDYFNVAKPRNIERGKPPPPFKTLFPESKFQDRIADTERRVRECKYEVMTSIESHEYIVAIQTLSFIFMDALAKNHFKSSFSLDSSQTETFNRILSNYNEDSHNKILEDINSTLYRAGFQLSQIIPVNSVKPFRNLALGYVIHVTILS
jgi:hypothetical protein